MQFKNIYILDNIYILAISNYQLKNVQFQAIPQQLTALDDSKSSSPPTVCRRIVEMNKPRF